MTRAFTIPPMFEAAIVASLFDTAIAAGCDELQADAAIAIASILTAMEPAAQRAGAAAAGIVASSPSPTIPATRLNGSSRPVEERQAELSALMREIHDRARELAALRLRRKRLADKLRMAALRRRHVPKTAHERDVAAAAARRYRAKRKAKRLADPYLGRQYDDARAA